MQVEHSNESEIITAEIEQKFNLRFEGWKRLYARRIKRGLIYHHTTQLSVLFGSALVPLLLTIPDVPKIVPTIVSGLVLVASTLTAYYKFSERLTHLQQTLDMMVEEDIKKDLRTGPYHNLSPKEAYAFFVERTARIIHNQNTYSYTYGEASKTLASKEEGNNAEAN